MTRLLTILVCVLACCDGARADHLSDIREWPTNGLPCASVWAGGHDLKWSVPQVQAGRRLLPHVIMPIRKHATDPRGAEKLAPFAAELQYINEQGLPLVLRHQSNLSSDMTQEPRGTLPDSPTEWRIDPNGVLDSKPSCDCFAPAGLWSKAGTDYGRGPWATALESKCPNLAWAGIWDNNEAGYPEPQSYCRDKPPIKWRPREELTGISLRMRDRVDTLGYGSNPLDFWPEFYGLRRAQYSAFFAAWHADAWPNTPLRTLGYGAGAKAGLPPAVSEQIGFAPEADCYDGSGPSFYPGNFLPVDLLAPEALLRVSKNLPAWEWLEARNPAAFRTIFVSMSPEAAQRAGGVTPDVFRAWVEWLAWQCRSRHGGPLLIEHWIGSSTKPTDTFFGEWKHGDYSIVPALVCDSICREEVREFWQNGVAVPCSVSNANVRAACVFNSEKYLLYVWSPKVLTGEMTVTVAEEALTIECPSAGSSYWILEPPPAVGLVARKVH